MQSKRKDIEELFFCYHSGRWSFKKIKERIDISDNKLSKWLKELEKDKIIRKIRPKGKHPYYEANFPNPEFANAKKQYTINHFYDSGLINHITKDENIRLAIIFGSMTRCDWHKKSDIDLFFLGKENNFDEHFFQKKLGRKFHIFSYKNKDLSKKISKPLLKNISRGIVIKGDILDLFEDGKIKGRI